jgi:hypothetical protein
MEVEIRQLTSQLQVAQEKLVLHNLASPEGFLSPILAQPASRLRTPSITPSPPPSLPSFAPSAGAATTSMPRSSTHPATDSGATIEYVDAADAGNHIIYDGHVQTYDYIMSLTAKNMGNLEKLIDEPYICRWRDEWTNKVNAMKKSGDSGDETVRLKLGVTSDY